MPPRLAASNDGLRLDHKARQTILAALRNQIGTWNAVTEAEVGEDAFADLQNDILYAEALLASLEEQFAALESSG